MTKLMTGENKSFKHDVDIVIEEVKLREENSKQEKKQLGRKNTDRA